MNIKISACYVQEVNNYAIDLLLSLFHCRSFRIFETRFQWYKRETLILIFKYSYRQSRPTKLILAKRAKRALETYHDQKIVVSFPFFPFSHFINLQAWENALKRLWIHLSTNFKPEMLFVLKLTLPWHLAADASTT